MWGLEIFLTIVLFTIISIVSMSICIKDYVARKHLERKNKKDIHALPGPKPFPLRFIGNLLQLPKNNDLIIPRIYEWCRQHGPCFRLSILNRDFVVISDASFAQSVLQSHEIGHLTKTDVYSFLKEMTGLAFSSGLQWQTMRRLVSPAFQYQTTQSRILFSNNHGLNLVRSLSTAKDMQEIEDLVAGCTVDIVIDSFISGPGACSHMDSIDYVKNWKKYTEITTYRMIHPWLAFDCLWKRHTLYKEMKKTVDKLNKFADLLIQPHLIGFNMEREVIDSIKNNHKNTLVAKLLELNYDKERIRSEVLTMLFGHEAFFYGFYYLLFMLAVHPEHQNKCWEEVRQLTKNKQDSVEFTMEDASQLKYVERCLLETLRMLPPAFIFGRKLESELKLDNGIVLPVGTNAMIVPLVIHRMTKYYQEPEKFEPDRFLPENTKTRHPYAYLPFSAGPRVCLGMKPAILTIKIFVAHILNNYVITTSDTAESVKFKVSLGMVPKRSLNLVFRPHKNDIADS